MLARPGLQSFSAQDRETRRQSIADKPSKRPDKQPIIVHEHDDNPAQAASTLSSIMDDTISFVTPMQINQEITTVSSGGGVEDSLSFRLFNSVDQVSLSYIPPETPQRTREYEFSEQQEQDLVAKFNQIAVSADDIFRESAMSFACPPCWHRRVIVGYTKTSLPKTNTSSKAESLKKKKKCRPNKRRRLVDYKLKKGQLKKRVIVSRRRAIPQFHNRPIHSRPAYQSNRGKPRPAYPSSNRSFVRNPNK